MNRIDNVQTYSNVANIKQDVAKSTKDNAIINNDNVEKTIIANQENELQNRANEIKSQIDNQSYEININETSNKMALNLLGDVRA